MQPIKDILQELDMQEGVGGLVFVKDRGSVTNPYEVLALDQAAQFNATAVYFRRIFNEDASETLVSKPQVYIYDQDFSDVDIENIHRNLWSAGVVPFFYVVSTTELKIFNCTKPVEKVRGKLKALEIFTLIRLVQKGYDTEKYSAKLFDNGTFWEHEDNQKLLSAENSPYQKLLNGLLNAKRDLESPEKGMNPQTISKLLVMGVLVRYLEEKQDIYSNKLLALRGYKDFFSQFPNCTNFVDVLRNGHCVAFFDRLAQKFNGKIFELEPQEKADLQNANLRYVADVFDARLEGEQYVMWELYSFNHLPIELISGIYEALLNQKDRSDIVYTPPYLVNFLVDRCMPLHKAEELFINQEFKVLDPSCGSGIFLVTAFKRMIEWQAIIDYRKTGQIAYPNIQGFLIKMGK